MSLEINLFWYYFDKILLKLTYYTLFSCLEEDYLFHLDPVTTCSLATSNLQKSIGNNLTNSLFSAIYINLFYFLYIFFDKINFQKYVQYIQNLNTISVFQNVCGLNLSNKN